MQKKLWQTSPDINPIVENFTVGDDYILDTKLLPYDIIGSIAHTKMLESIGIISSTELLDLEKGLDEILELSRKGEFQILKSQEDCHTAIEQYLTEHYGEVGKKIHTGRSRNDQVLTMLRLFMKDRHVEFTISIQSLTKKMDIRA
jgi:argininosuccinate lyase